MEKKGMLTPQALRYSLDVVKKHFSGFLPFLLVMIGLILISPILAQLLPKLVTLTAYGTGKKAITNHQIIISIVTLLISFISYTIKLSVAKAALDIYDRDDSDATLFSGIAYLPQMIVLSILGGLFFAGVFILGVLIVSLFGITLGEKIGIGMFLVYIPFSMVLLVPLIIRLLLVPYFIIDQDSGAIQSLKQSYHATKGKFWDLLFLMLCFTGINWILSLFFLAPLGAILATVGYAFVYKKITEKSYKERIEEMPPMEP